ncbi:MAG: ABC transporter permease [Actinomycetota bacterium]|nr:ABC transporter permease [Actinomycetota bacterium]
MSEAPTHRGIHERLAELPPPETPEFNPRHTLRLRVEFVRQLRRRRTQLALVVLLILPILIALAFKIGGAASGGPDLVDLATTGAVNFALFTEFAAVGFLLVVMVALFCGDTVASEANWASLRYLLAMPVPRARFLKQKLVVALTLSFAANLILPMWGLAVGQIFFGSAPFHSPLGATIGFGEAMGRLALVIAYACGQALVVAALAFLLSVTVDNPLGAVGGATLLVVVSNIIDSITALDPYRRFLPTHFQYSWLDALGPSISWDDMLRGTGLALVYASIFFAVAWLRFDRKDITS